VIVPGPMIILHAASSAAHRIVPSTTFPIDPAAAIRPLVPARRQGKLSIVTR